MKPDVEQSPWQLQEEWPRIQREFDQAAKRCLELSLEMPCLWETVMRTLIFRSEAFIDRTGRHG
jgi:hypothetical protein